uniref:Phosphodiesterase n=1 Tax=Meloidogyne incognita TaxID=6306 RepID=A0A914L3V3_MELIC
MADQFITRLSINTPKGSTIQAPASPDISLENLNTGNLQKEDISLPNFMHDPCTQADFTTNAEMKRGQQFNGPVRECPKIRKASLMPPLTEEDLRISGMGHKDPESVAQLFGEDFASRFCLGPLLLPHEIRDSSVPHGVPTVKIRRRMTAQNSVDLPNADSVVALSPFAPKFPSVPCCNTKEELVISSYSDFEHSSQPVSPSNQWLTTPLNYPTSSIPGVVQNPPLPFPVELRWTADGRTKMTSFVRPKSGEFYLDMAALHPDLLQFQLALNDWIKRQCRIRGSALLLSSQEQNSTYCQVCGDQLLEVPLQCGDADFLFTLLRACANQSDNYDKNNIRHEDLKGEEIGANTFVLARVELLEESVRSAINPLLEMLNNILNSKMGNDLPPLQACFSLVGLRSNSGFSAGLVLAHNSEQDRLDELKLLDPHLGMLGTLMTLMHNIEEQRRLAQQSQVFLSMTQNVFSSLQDMHLLVRNITKEAKALVHAEICSLFLLDKEHSELVAEVFEKNGTSEEYLTEIRMPLNQGIVGHVATTGQMMNVTDVYNHPFFYPKVDERTGFLTRNILCFPIKDSSGNLVGVAELCNKIGRDTFTRYDEQIAATFAVYCAISLSHCLLYRKLQEAHRRSHMAAELLVQGSTLSIAPEDILRLTVRDIPPPLSFHPEFDKLNFVPRSIGSGDIYVEASLAIFRDLGFIERFRLRRRTLARFLLMVQKGYRDVPYHNWSHAFAVSHFCYLLLRMNKVRDVIGELERFGLLVACLCHDIDHRGTTNAFQLQSKTPLAQLYSSEGSVLERHHFAQTVTILGMDECNIFEQLNRQQYLDVLDCIREVILATDIAAHLRKVDRIKQMAEGGFENGNAEHRYLFMCLLMTASDLSDQTKDFHHSKAIAENIYKEFFSQGDLEKQMGNRPIAMMDRDRACVPKIQIEFMDTVALPVFKFLADLLPELRTTHEAILTNRLCWHSLDQILLKQGFTTGGLEYLRDTCLEEKVLMNALQEQIATKDKEIEKDLEDNN